ncbi:glycosyltransferase family 2 protein [Rhodoplanes sp. Z2-YC6860]|uniref:glycosyltransferase family 2 protein n=1 Tax=Rhodoplanes sp. Z2-YC6860 TaxID=674703 RepID=UPI00078E904E|nr:glycosyltransferase [Rhodoplanes sp. Z2-YC6860]AMN39122.1 glycosyl transferase family protein [Rhodoplanes sp. Z2-YC6860]
MPTGDPKISVVMPVFNCESWLPQALESIGTQSFPGFELIVVDDGSTDRSCRIVEDAARSDSRIRLERQARLGISAALNRAVALARSPIIARMDGDDVAAPNRLQMQMDFLGSHPDVAAAGSWARVIGHRNEVIGELKPDTLPSRLREILPKQNPFVHSSMAIRGDILRSLGGYRQALDGAEDYDLWLRISERAELANLPEFLLSYRSVRPQSNEAAIRKQLLAARLARLSAKARRDHQTDFVDTLPVPLDLATLGQRDDLRATAELYRLLARPVADPVPVGDFGILAGTELNHAERKTAQFWLRDVLQSQRTFAARSMALYWLLKLHPARGLTLIGSALRAK